jgi:hypothetical protein
MIHSEHPRIVTLMASPSAGAEGATGEPFIDAARQVLAGKHAPGTRILYVSSVRDIDLALCRVFSDPRQDAVRLQIIGHHLSGGLALGAIWIAEAELQARAFKFPYPVLDTNPAALGLLSKHAGKISELMLVGCDIGSATPFGHAINGRTLTYTLAELLHCTVLGADDVVAPDEFDPEGWYAPSAQRRGPKGWRWTQDAPPIWTERTSRRRVKAA